jgi:DNA segregation ATPase FtsK/SpoIIIE-like protein
MNAGLIAVWRRAHAVPWYLLAVVVRAPLSSSIAVLIIWALLGAAPVVAVFWALMILALGGDMRTRMSSIVTTAKSAYLRTKIRLTWAGTMHRAKLFETVQIEDALHSPRTHPGGRKVPRLKRWGRDRVRFTPAGLALTVDGSNIGAGASAFEGDQATVLKARWRALDLIVGPAPGRPYLTELRVIKTDPFAAVIRPSQLPPAPLPPTGLCTIGKDSDGNWVTKDARMPNLMAGAPGAGKSSECWALLHELCRQKLPFRVRVYDPKGGQEFFNLDGLAYRYEADPTQWCRFLEEAIAAMAAQQHSLKSAGKRKWVPGNEQWPLDVMVIDELVTVIAMMAGAKNVVKINGKDVPALKAFLVFLSQCRAAGFSVVACTQLTQKEAIGLIRDLFAYVTCLRVGSDEMVKTILGNSKTYPAHEIPVGDAFAGIGYMADPASGRPIKYRSFYLEDSERDRVAGEIAVWSAMYRDAVKHDKGTPITLDLGDDDIDVTEIEQAALDELVHVCVECQKEFDAHSGELVGASA